MPNNMLELPVGSSGGSRERLSVPEASRSMDISFQDIAATSEVTRRLALDKMGLQWVRSGLKAEVVLM